MVIYCIYLMKDPYAELMSYRGEPLGLPGGHLEFIGYFETYKEARLAMHERLSEEHYQEDKNGGFIAIRGAGLNDCCISGRRQFFLWDPDKEGFYEAEEPEIWRHAAL